MTNRPGRLARGFVIRHWSFVIGHWSLVIGHLSFVIGHFREITGLAEKGSGFPTWWGRQEDGRTPSPNPIRTPRPRRKSGPDTAPCRSESEVLPRATSCMPACVEESRPRTGTPQFRAGAGPSTGRGARTSG